MWVESRFCTGALPEASRRQSHYPGPHRDLPPRHGGTIVAQMARKQPTTVDWIEGVLYHIKPIPDTMNVVENLILDGSWAQEKACHYYSAK